MNILLSGGCKNGKSALAEALAVRLSPNGKRCYVATMIPSDGEDRARIAKHIESRAGLGFQTLEVGRNIASCLEGVGGGATYLVDSVTALLANEMFLPDGSVHPEAAALCIRGLTEIAKQAENAVFVSDYIYSDAVRYDALTENYRAALASVDRALAAVCDTVVELCAGNLICHKGRLPQ